MIIDEPFPFESSCLMINALLLFLGDVFMKLGLKRFKIRFLHSADLHQSMLYHPNLDFVDIKENPRKTRENFHNFQNKSNQPSKVKFKFLYVFAIVKRIQTPGGSRCVRGNLANYRKISTRRDADQNI